MSSSSGVDIQQALDSAMAARPYTHQQDVDSSVVAVVTVEEDTRFLTPTLRALLTQSTLPGTIVIADAADQGFQPFQASFEVIHSPAGLVMEVPQTKQVVIQVINAKGAKSFSDAVAKALKQASTPHGTELVWMLHDDSRPADENCLEQMLETVKNRPGATVFGCKQLNWDGDELHSVGMYAGTHDVHSLVIDSEPDQEQYDGRSDVYAVSLAGALVSLKQIESLGGINAWFSTYGESIDFCRRVCQSGGRVVVVPQARIAHRRARLEGIRSRSGEPLDEDSTVNSSMSVMRAAQRFHYTDIPVSRWPLTWLWSLVVSIGAAFKLLFKKQPYEAWSVLRLPWAELKNLPQALKARKRVAKQSTVSTAQLQELTVDNQQLKEFRDKRRLYEQQGDAPILSPLEKAHLRSRLIRRWSLAAAMALICFVAVVATHWQAFLSMFTGGSIYSDELLATGASFKQLAQSATTQWIFGSGTGVPAPPTPWLLVLLVTSVFTLGHVAAAASLIYFLAAPLAALAFWALAGIFTRSNVVRVLGGFLWVSLAMAFGFFAEGNLPMLTVMVFLPAAFAFVFRAVGMYHTEDPLKPHASVTAAALAALCFIPVVAAEPQLLLALVAAFLVFLIFVRNHRTMLLLIPIPAAVAVAPTLINAIRYFGEGSWRQLFGDIMQPSSSHGSPAALGLIKAVQRVLSWNGTASAVLNVCMSLVFVVIVALALVSLVLPFALRSSRLMWVVAVCGGLLAMASSRIAVGLDADGVAAGSAAPGLVLMMLAMLSCVCLVAGGAVKRFEPLHASATDPKVKTSKTGNWIAIGRVVLAVLLAACVGVQCWFAVDRTDSQSLKVSTDGLPMVAVDYLEQNPAYRILAIHAETENIVEYSVMRTSRGELIDSSPAERVRAMFGTSDESNASLTSICAKLLANADAEAISELSAMGFGGIYVAADDASTSGYEQLSANVAASEGTQSLVTNEHGSYYRLMSMTGQNQQVDTGWQQNRQHNVWRYLWLICLAVTLVVYCLVALPRRRTKGLEES